MIYTDGKYRALKEENCLRFDASGFERLYEVEIFFEENRNSKTRLSHSAFVKTLEAKGEDAWLVSVVLWNYLVNNEKPDMVMEQLAEKCRRPLEKLELVVNSQWEVTGLHNHEAILQSWAEVRQRLEEEYSGEIFEKYIQKHEEALLNRDVLLAKLKKDLFITQFFSGMYNRAFHDFSLASQENIRAMNMDYTVDMVYKVKEKQDSENLFVEKEIDRQQYAARQMPIDNYNAAYELKDDFSVKNIYGSFENYGRKLAFSINEDAGLAR